jgi:hypothetical protein
MLTPSLAPLVERLEAKLRQGPRTGRLLSCERKVRGVDPITNGEDHTSAGARTKPFA